MGANPAAAADVAGWWSRIRTAGTILRPSVVVLTLVMAAFLLAMLLVLQLQMQAARIATVNELERELAQLQRMRSALLVEVATASDLPRIQQRAVELGLQPSEPAAAYELGSSDGLRNAVPSAWTEPLPPQIPHWRERLWDAVLRWAGRGPAGA